MAGGTFTSHNKTRPGAYVNVRSEGIAASGDGVQGIATVPVTLGFGPVKKVQEVNSGTNFNTLYGYGLGDPEMVSVREALKRSGTLLLYRLNGGEKASAELGEGQTATAKYEGEKGNDIRIAIQEDIDNPDTFVVSTYYGSRLIDTQEQVETFSDLENNAMVDFSGEGVLTTSAGVNLSGASTTEVTAGDYSDYFEAVSVHDWNAMAITAEDEEIKVSAASFVRRMRDDEGKKCQVVIGKYPGNHESVINVANGVTLADGTELTAEQATAWVAGATAAAAVNESLTYVPYDGASDPFPRLTNDDVSRALRRGEFVFTASQDRVVVEQDINSLTTFTADKNQEFAKNRVLRVLDGIANNTKQVFETNFIGRLNNNEDGRALFRANRLTYFGELQDIGAIENFDADTLTVEIGETKDSVVVNVAVTPVDSMEKLYMTVIVQ